MLCVERMVFEEINILYNALLCVFSVTLAESF